MSIRRQPTRAQKQNLKTDLAYIGISINAPAGDDGCAQSLKELTTKYELLKQKTLKTQRS
jgi:hypothetical protein